MINQHFLDAGTYTTPTQFEARVPVEPSAVFVPVETVEIQSLGLRLSYAKARTQVWTGRSSVRNEIEYRLTRVEPLQPEQEEYRLCLTSQNPTELERAVGTSKLGLKLATIIYAGLALQDEFNRTGNNKAEWRGRGRQIATLAEAIEATLGQYLPRIEATEPNYSNDD